MLPGLIHLRATDAKINSSILSEKFHAHIGEMSFFELP